MIHIHTSIHRVNMELFFCPNAVYKKFSEKNLLILEYKVKSFIRNYIYDDGNITSKMYTISKDKLNCSGLFNKNQQYAVSSVHENCIIVSESFKKCKRYYYRFLTWLDASMFLKKYNDLLTIYPTVCYTDGSFNPNYKIGGYGIVVLTTTSERCYYGGLRNITSVCSELFAIWKGLSITKGDIIIYTDCLGAITQITNLAQKRTVKHTNNIKLLTLNFFRFHG